MNFSFFLAYRYFKSKKKLNAVNIIVFFSIIAITFSTAAMIVVLSAFSGLQNLNIQFISNVNSEIKISSVEGKLLKNLPEIEKKLQKNTEIQSFSKVIEEKVYITYRERSEVAKLKAVGENFTKIYPLDTTIIAGAYPSFLYTNEMVMSNGLAYRMNIPISTTEFAEMYMPKAGTGRIINVEDNFIVKPVYLTGVYYINDQYENTIFAPIELAEELLGLPKNSAFSIEIKLKNAEDRKAVKESVQSQLGTAYKVETREDQDASFLKMMNIEKMFIYLLLTLIIIITTFNLAGALVVIILDKKKQTQTLLAMGLTLKNLKKSYFYTGLIIVFVGLIAGLLLGSLATFFQYKFEWVKANASFPFPVEFNVMNYLIVTVTVIIFGSLVTYLASRKIEY